MSHWPYRVQTRHGEQGYFSAEEIWRDVDRGKLSLDDMVTLPTGQMKPIAELDVQSSVRAPSPSADWAVLAISVLVGGYFFGLIGLAAAMSLFAIWQVAVKKKGNPLRWW